MRACVIFNPTAKGDKARGFRRQLDALQMDCALKPTTSVGAARALAAEAVREGFDTIVATGGDGTVNEVLNGIGDEPDGFARVRLGVIPLGTANVFARELQIPRSVKRAWTVLRQGRETAIDLPVAEFVRGARTERRYFGQMAGAGLDARAVELVDWSWKKKTGFAAYILAGLKALAEEHGEITATGGGHAVGGEQVLIGNGRLYGGPFVVFPKADPCDGLLDVCVFPRVNWATVAACLWGLVTNRLSRSAGARHFQAEAVSLTSTRRTPLELDGETAGELPVKFVLRRRALRVIAP